MLERYGIVTRETVLAEGIPGGFSTLYAELGNLELLGTARRGYFVEGLGGAQFALPGAVERLRSLPDERRLLPCCSRPPTRPTPTAPRCPGRSRRAAAAPPAPPAPTSCSATASRSLYVERGGRGIVRLVELERRRADGRRCAPSPTRSPPAACRSWRVEKLDGEPVIGSGHEDALLEAGFSRGPRKLTARGPLSAVGAG